MNRLSGSPLAVKCSPPKFDAPEEVEVSVSDIVVAVVVDSDILRIWLKVKSREIWKYSEERNHHHESCLHRDLEKEKFSKIEQTKQLLYFIIHFELSKLKCSLSLYLASTDLSPCFNSETTELRNQTKQRFRIRKPVTSQVRIQLTTILKLLRTS